MPTPRGVSRVDRLRAMDVTTHLATPMQPLRKVPSEPIRRDLVAACGFIGRTPGNTHTRRVMLDQQTRQQLQSKFQQIKPQLQGQFSGLTDQDLEVGRTDPDTLIDTISRKTGQGREQVEQTVRKLVTTSTNF